MLVFSKLPLDIKQFPWYISISVLSHSVSSSGVARILAWRREGIYPPKFFKDMGPTWFWIWGWHGWGISYSDLYLSVELLWQIWWLTVILWGVPSPLWKIVAFVEWSTRCKMMLIFDANYWPKTAWNLEKVYSALSYPFAHCTCINYRSLILCLHWWAPPVVFFFKLLL